MRKILSAATVGVWLAAGFVSAHEGHEHKAMGTVAAVDAKHLEVSDKEGKKSSFVLTAETKYKHGTMAAEASHVAVGQRVVVVYMENAKDKSNVATEVLIGMPEKTAPAPAQPHGHH